jgi:hypothetical protein
MKRLVLVIVLVLAIDSSAREPIVSPPPKIVAPPVTNKAVRARDLGIPFNGVPGALNSITDVAGVEVGYTTLISGEGKLEAASPPLFRAVTIR